MSLNQAVSERLHEMGAMMDLLGMDSFRANSHTRAGRAIAELDQDVAELAKDRKGGRAFAARSSERLWLGRAAALAEQMVTRVKSVPGVARAEAAGSLRRGKDTVGDIDILVAMEPGREKDDAKVAEAFRSSPR